MFALSSSIEVLYMLRRRAEKGEVEKHQIACAFYTCQFEILDRIFPRSLVSSNSRSTKPKRKEACGGRNTASERLACMFAREGVEEDIYVRTIPM